MHSSETDSRPKSSVTTSKIEHRLGSMNWVIVKPIALTLFGLVVLVLVASCPTQAQTETVLYNFTGGSDGASPQSPLTTDHAGNFFGTTYGGVLGSGTAYELSPNNTGGWNKTVLHSFNGGLNIGPDGSGPSGPLIFDSEGNLFGTTRFGGTDYFYCSYGTVFELSPVGAGWNESIPFSESCSQPLGFFPVNGLIMDAAGKLYFTTPAIGQFPGTVVELSPSNGGWTPRVIYEAPTSSGLSMDASGNIYGATSSTVFRLSPNSNGGWNATVIHTFTGYPYDGIDARGTPVLDHAGNLFGTTYGGGATKHGTVYKLSPGKNGVWTEEILHSFKSGKDGANPVAGIVLDAAGNIYGTTELGGSFNKGTVFELAATGNLQYEYTILWTFNGTNGALPVISLILNGADNLYGTTSSGGASNAGAVFDVTGLRAAPATRLTSSLNPSIYGQAVTWTATVTTSSSSVTPTGNVVFRWSRDGRNFAIGTAPLNASGVAVLTRSNLDADPFGSPYPLVAVYSGDAVNLGSSSDVLLQNVLQAKSVATITSSMNPSSQSQPVTFTAKITSPTVKATGPVTFSAGSTVLGTAQLSGGTAKFTTSALPAGATRVTVTYYGDSNIAKSSASLIQTVR